MRALAIAIGTFCLGVLPSGASLALSDEESNFLRDTIVGEFCEGGKNLEGFVPWMECSGFHIAEVGKLPREKDPPGPDVGASNVEAFLEVQDECE